MVKRLARVLPALCLLVLAASETASAAAPIMPLVQVKSGMKGIGRCVFQGNKIEDFDVEILGVLRNFRPKKSLILARLQGRGLEKSGVIQGMSGSPVYIDGKIAGAVAYSFAFAKEAIAGITPIEEMLALQASPPPLKPALSPDLPVQKYLTVEELFDIYSSAFSSQAEAASAGQPFAPLAVPLVFSGFSPRTFDKVKPMFARLGLQPVQGGTGGQAAVPLPAASLREGDPVGVQLVGGDLDMSAIGTVTYVDGNRVLAFGHPLYNLGSVDYVMTRADVITTMPSLQSSFMIAGTGSVIGRFTQDRGSGAVGELGKAAQVIPLNVQFQSAPGEKKEMKIRIINDRILAPALVNMAIASIITGEERSFGNLSLNFEGDIYLDNGQSVHLEDLFSGNYDTPSTNLAGLVAAAVYFLTNNDFRDIGIHRIDLNIQASEQAKFCSLEKVLLDKYEVNPGERIQVKVFYRTYKEESFLEDVQIQTPYLPAGSEFYLVIGDALAMQQVERVQYRTQDFVPRSLGQLIRILNNLRKNNRIYFKIMAVKPGLFLKGEEMPNLPPTLKSMFSSARAAASSPTELTRSTLSEYQLPVPYVFKGVAVVPIKIRK